MIELDISNIEEQIKKEKENLMDKVGIEKFFTPNLDDPIDQEIVRRIKDKGISYINNRNCNLTPGFEERVCRSILVKRLKSKGLNAYHANEKTDNLIKSKIEVICLKQQRLWNDVVRELFCIEFNIKS